MKIKCMKACGYVFLTQLHSLLRNCNLDLSFYTLSNVARFDCRDFFRLRKLNFTRICTCVPRIWLGRLDQLYHTVAGTTAAHSRSEWQLTAPNAPVRETAPAYGRAWCIAGGAGGSGAGRARGSPAWLRGGADTTLGTQSRDPRCVQTHLHWKFGFRFFRLSLFHARNHFCLDRKISGRHIFVPVYRAIYLPVRFSFEVFARG